MTCGIYRISRKGGPRSECYIGQSIDIERRWAGHIHLLVYQQHINRYLQGAWTAYGPAGIEFSVVKEIERWFSLEILKARLDQAEQMAIENYAASWNIAPVVAFDKLPIRGVSKKQGRAKAREIMFQRMLADIPDTVVGNRDIRVEPFEYRETKKKRRKLNEVYRADLAAGKERALAERVHAENQRQAELIEQKLQQRRAEGFAPCKLFVRGSLVAS